jgi:hypothetical protein
LKARSDADEQSRARCDANETGNRIENAMGGLLSKQRKKKGNGTANQRKRAKKLCDENGKTGESLGPASQ